MPFLLVPAGVADPPAGTSGCDGAEEPSAPALPSARWMFDELKLFSLEF